MRLKDDTEIITIYYVIREESYAYFDPDKIYWTVSSWDKIIETKKLLFDEKVKSKIYVIF